MRVAVAFLVAAVSLASGAACIPRDWCRRNGLTDAQVEEIFGNDKDAVIHLTAGMWRNMKYNTFRFANVTNWLDICGETNDFAALSFDLQGKNFTLLATNEVLVATNRQLTATCVALADEVVNQWNNYTNQLAQTESYSNAYVIASGVAKAATAKIQDEIADLQAKIVKYKEYQTKYPLLKAIFATMISDAENRIKILQALTS